MHLRRMSLAAVWLLLLASASLSVASPELPVLDWIPRSDWYNVRVNGSAVGDGVADDTAAIQLAINLARVNDSMHTTVYLPPGTYRVTSRLKMVDKMGCSMVGHGGSTVIRWDGPRNDWLFESDGNPSATFTGTVTPSTLFFSIRIFRSGSNSIFSFLSSKSIVFVGITWDGAGVCSWGFVHSAKVAFESKIRHQFSVFRGFLYGGLRAGGSYQSYASSEQQVRNCLFMDSPRYCVSVQDPNYYNHQFHNNDFHNCGIGLSMVYFAQGSIWRNHFQNSSDTDIEAGEPSYTHSVRRCSSVGSRMFFRHDSGSSKFSLQVRVSPHFSLPLHGRSFSSFFCRVLQLKVGRTRSAQSALAIRVFDLSSICASPTLLQRPLRSFLLLFRVPEWTRLWVESTTLAQQRPRLVILPRILTGTFNGLPSLKHHALEMYLGESRVPISDPWSLIALRSLSPQRGEIIPTIQPGTPLRFRLASMQLIRRKTLLPIFQEDRTKSRTLHCFIFLVLDAHD
jgi:hypothetical protein